MNFHSGEKQICKSFDCTKIAKSLKINQNEPKRSNAIHDFFLTMCTNRHILRIALLTEETLFTLAF